MDMADTSKTWLATSTITGRVGSRPKMADRLAAKNQATDSGKHGQDRPRNQGRTGHSSSRQVGAGSREGYQANGSIALALATQLKTSVGGYGALGRCSRSRRSWPA